MVEGWTFSSNFSTHSNAIIHPQTSNSRTGKVCGKLINKVKNLVLGLVLHQSAAVVLGALETAEKTLVFDLFARILRPRCRYDPGATSRDVQLNKEHLSCHKRLLDLRC